ncbi:MAG: ABC transporter permease [Synergistaceae bacterium]|jgi:simple sugar transport system permease protein|nr:ABC transporter permease [Synergistaceae bacterium]
MRQKLPDVLRSPYFWSLLFLAALLIFNILFTERFGVIEVRDGHFYGNIMDILRRSVPTVLLGTGMTLVIATGGIDLSVGAVIAVSGAIGALLARDGYPLPVIIALPLAAALISGVWNGFLVAKIGIQPFVATLILMVSGRGIAQLLCGGQIIKFSDPSFEYISAGFILGFPFSMYLAAAVLAAVQTVTRKTALGLFIESIGVNPAASRCVGINATSIKLIVYAFSGLCAGIAGLLLTTEIRGADANNVGLNLEMDAILATVIGGTAMTGGKFYLAGSVIGALIIQTLTTTILARGVTRPATLVVKAIVVISISLIQSSVFRSQLSGLLAGRGGRA